MKILLLGKDGQLGWELQRSLAPLGEVVACGRGEVDLENLPALQALVRKISPQVIVNAAAYTAVDKAESEPDRALLINSEAVDLLAKEVCLLNGWFIHYSTDYVFDGSKKELMWKPMTLLLLASMVKQNFLVKRPSVLPVAST
jgi:dTDP-4-dehydrorhamnose reductase